MLELDELKNLDLIRLSLEEVVYLYGTATSLKRCYMELSTDAPVWLDERISELKREVRTRKTDVMAKRLREAKIRLESLKTAEEKREALRKEIAELEAAIPAE
jgi:hypothetical protein